MKSCFFKLYRPYSVLFSLSNVGEFFGRLNSKRLCQSSGKKKESLCVVFTSSTKRENRNFHVVKVVVQWWQRNVQKLLFCQSKPIAFLPFLSTSLLSLLEPFFASKWLLLMSLLLKNEVCCSGVPKNRKGKGISIVSLTWQSCSTSS